MSESVPGKRRTGARRLTEVPAKVLAGLNRGETETVNLMEWLAVDMGRLARHVAKSAKSARVRDALLKGASEIADLGVTERLKVMGRHIAAAIREPDDDHLTFLARHPSDIVRQWACYAVNSDYFRGGLPDRIQSTLAFAEDRNMSVREAAWMALRPHLSPSVPAALATLEPLTRSPNENVRRFAIEVTRPRSVWGTHLTELKRNPQLGISLLENVRSDGARYVQLATGNWLNDASKSRPDWVIGLCDAWLKSDEINTRKIVLRAMRTIRKSGAAPRDSMLFDLQQRTKLESEALRKERRHQ